MRETVPVIMCIQLTVHSHATLDVHNHSFKDISAIYLPLCRYQL